MESRARERCRVRQQAQHPVVPPFPVDKPASQHHVAAAFTVDGRAAQDRCMHALPEPPGTRQPAGMEFRVAAGEEDRIGGSVRRPVVQRRKEREFGTCPAPTGEEVLVEECERIIAGDRDSLAEWRHGRPGPGNLRRPERFGRGQQRLHIHTRPHRPCSLIQEGRNLRVLTRRNKSKVARRQCEILIPVQTTEYPNAMPFHRRPDHPSVPFRTEPVEDDALDIDFPEGRAQTQDREHRRRALPGDINHQHDRKAEFP